MGDDISSAARLLVVERAVHRCEYCLLHQDDSFTPHQIDTLSAGSTVAIPRPATLRWLVSIAMIPGEIAGATTFGSRMVRSCRLRKMQQPRYVCFASTCSAV
jgi:hypothetical protein